MRFIFFAGFLFFITKKNFCLTTGMNAYIILQIMYLQSFVNKRIFYDQANGVIDDKWHSIYRLRI